jgi:hypothetical protein
MARDQLHGRSTDGQSRGFEQGVQPLTVPPFLAGRSPPFKVPFLFLLRGLAGLSAEAPVGGFQQELLFSRI